MNTFEQRVRDSLQSRAADVAATPALWREVDRRITRRRRTRLAAWSFAGVAAVVVAVLVLPGLVGPGLSVPEIDPVAPTPPSSPETEAPSPGAGDPTDPAPSQDASPAPGDPEAQDPSDSGDVDLPPDPRPMVIAAGGALQLLSHGETTLLHELPAEGESFVTGLAVRPGSTPQNLTAAVLTRSEGMYDLRELRVVDGEATLELFPEPHRPASPTDAGAQVVGPVWSPDGATVAWFEFGAEGGTLRTVGWADGPGTGDRATDNASFQLGDELPHGAVPNDWVATGEDVSVLRATMPDSNEGFYALDLERQADGGLVLDTPIRTVGVADPGLGPVGAVAGLGVDGQPEWLVRLAVDGAVLERVGTDGVQQLRLPEGLLADDGLAAPWALAAGDHVVVGGRGTGTAVLVGPDGGVTELGHPAVVADVVR